jgi:hypothetical protein
MCNTLTMVDNDAEPTDLERSAIAAEGSARAIDAEGDTSTIPKGNGWLLNLTWREPTGDEMDEAGW